MNRKISATLAALAALAVLTACEKQPQPPPEPGNKIQTVADLKPPTNVGPPVNSANYEDGYKEGMTAGEAAARSLPPRTKAPSPEDRSVYALEAAGQETTRGPRWQRGYASGYKDGFERISMGLK